MIKDIEGKIDKVLITEKDQQKIRKWVEKNQWGGIDSVLNRRKFFPLKTFIFELQGKFKCLVELDGYDPVKGGRITTDNWCYTWKREYRNGGSGFEFDGKGQLNKELVNACHRVLIDCLMYICLAEREKEYRVSSNLNRTEKDPYEYQERVCFLLNDIVKYTMTHQTKKSIKYRCECWGVRGHIRHYQNGATVFIEPYKKGKKRDILEPKSRTYILEAGNAE